MVNILQPIYCPNNTFLLRRKLFAGVSYFANGKILGSKLCLMATPYFKEICGTRKLGKTFL